MRDVMGYGFLRTSTPYKGRKGVETDGQHHASAGI